MEVRRGMKQKEEKEKEEMPQWGEPSCCGGDEGDIRKVGNHIYYYAPVTSKNVVTLIDGLHTLANDQQIDSIEHGGSPPAIVLHINSGGGSIYSGIAAMEAVRRCPVPIHAIVDGVCASAATFPLMVAEKRIMNMNSYMLIHQLSNWTFGKFSELQDEMKNNEEFMRLIKKIYLKHTKIPEGKLDKILKHDLWFDSAKCLKYGMIDEIV